MIDLCYNRLAKVNAGRFAFTGTAGHNFISSDVSKALPSCGRFQRLPFALATTGIRRERFAMHESELDTLEFYLRYEYQNLTEDLFEWLRSIPFYLGLETGLYLRGKSSTIPMIECHPPKDFEGMKYSWAYYYGSLYISLNLQGFKYHGLYGLGGDWHTFQVHGRRRDGIQNKEYLLFLYTKIDNTIHKFFPRIIQKSGVRPCSLCADSEAPAWAYFRKCVPIGDKWICKDCQDRFSLPSPVKFQEEIKKSHEKTFAEEQRMKMTPTLRYSILERDGFKCIICGRSPLHGDEVTLEVDHVKPVFKGGLTEPDNLQTLCMECNRGKGVKDFWVDPRPQRPQEAHGQWFGEVLKSEGTGE